MINKLSTERVNEIKEKVKEIYQSIGHPLDLETSEDTTLYFPIDKILEKNNIKLMNFDISDKSVSGAILANEGEVKILVNSKDKQTRKRFTVAHELAHYYLHKDQFEKDGAFIDYRDGSKEIKELEADYFAGYLLAPTEKLKALYPLLKLVYSEIGDRIQWLAEAFNISKNAMYVRLSQEDILYE